MNTQPPPPAPPDPLTQASAGSNITALLMLAALFVLLSMIFSAAESAFLSANKLRIRFLRRKKDKRAIRVGKLLDKREQLINTVIVANNLVNISLTAILTSIAIELFGNAGVAAATLVATVILLIFGEIAPKTIAASHPEKISFFLSGFISALFHVLSPLTYVLTRIAVLVARLFGVKPAESKQTFSEDDIKTIMEVGEEEGVLETDEKTMMHRVFKFTDLDASDLLQPRPKMVCVPVTARYLDVVELSQKTHRSRFPVYGENIDDILGVLYMKDVLAYEMQAADAGDTQRGGNAHGSGNLQTGVTSAKIGTEHADFSVKRLMKKALFIPESKKMTAIQRAMAESNNSICIVLDEYGGTAGLITIEDISRCILGMYGSRQSGEAPSLKGSSTTLPKLLSAQTRLMELEETYQLSFGATNAETVGGYLAEVLDAIPQTGDTAQVGDYTLRVTAATPTMVQEVEINFVDAEEAGTVGAGTAEAAPGEEVTE